MDYWNKSFGFFLVLGGGGFYILGIAILVIADKFLVKKLLADIRDRVRKLELRGFKQRDEYERDKAIEKRKEKEAAEAEAANGEN